MIINKENKKIININNLNNKIKKSRNGITLISLVITIIILFILATISITYTYNTKLIQEGNNISRSAEKEELKETIQYYVYAYTLEKNTKGDDLQDTKEEYVKKELNKVYEVDNDKNEVKRKYNDYDKKLELTASEYNQILAEQLK